MDKREKKRIDKIASEAAKILKDYPNLKYYEALARAKKIYGVVK